MRKHTVLALERQRENASDLQQLLGENNIVIQTFDDKEALDMLKRIGANIDVAIIGYDFLPLGNEGVLEGIKRQLRFYEIPVIASLDGYDLSQAAAAIDLGTAEIVIRPYEKTILRRRVYNMALRSDLKQARLYDSLTGIYNKEAFFKKAEELIQNDPQTDYTILCLDIDRFKIVNDLYGSEEGDRLLQFVGSRLKSGIAKTGVIAGRLVADIFACCYPGTKDSYEKIAEKVSLLFKSYPLDMEIVAAVGFYPVEDRSLPVGRMCDRAMLAISSVKNNYLINYAVYDKSMLNRLLMEQEMVNEMDNALKNREFKVYFQPQCDMNTGRIIGAEALTRWEHPRKGIVSPGDFIPVFEKNKFILKLDTYIWEEVCRTLRRWINEGRRVVPVSVNISRIHLYHEDLYKQLTELVQRYDLAPELLQLEITESSYSINTDYLSEVVQRLQDYGFLIFMDDFGSGYSSLNMLKDISVDVLKLDMRFLSGETSGHDRGGDIMAAMVQMARRLDLYVVAEGVENKEQVDFLLSINCNYAQGYYYYRPMTAEAFRLLIGDDRNIDCRGMRVRGHE